MLKDLDVQIRHNSRNKQHDSFNNLAHAIMAFPYERERPPFIVRAIGIELLTLN